VRIVRVANFVTERSGGLRTALRELGAGYQDAGHEAVLIMPGARHTDVRTGQGRVITLPAPRVPGMGGYRVLLDRRRVASVLLGLGRIGSRCRTGQRCGGSELGPGAQACPR
jgi:alpha-1,6-mannosyltransferase